MAMGNNQITGYQPPGLGAGGLSDPERQEVFAQLVPMMLSYLCHHSARAAPHGSRGRWFRDKHWRGNFKNKGPWCMDGRDCMCCKQAKYGILGLKGMNAEFTNEACEMCHTAWRLSAVDLAWSVCVAQDRQTHGKWWVKWTPEHIEQRNAYYRGAGPHPRDGTPGYQPRGPAPTKGKVKGSRKGQDRRGGWQGHSQQQMHPPPPTHSHTQQEQPLQSPWVSSWQHDDDSWRWHQYGQQQYGASVSGAAAGAERDVFPHQCLRELQWKPPEDARSDAASSGEPMVFSTAQTVTDHRGYQPQIEDVPERDPWAGINWDVVTPLELFPKYIQPITNDAKPPPQERPCQATLDLEPRRVLDVPDSGTMPWVPPSNNMVAWSQRSVDKVTLPSVADVSAADPVCVHTGDKPDASGASSQDTPSLDSALVSQRSAVAAIVHGPKVNAAANAPGTQDNGLSATNEDLDSLD